MANQATKDFDYLEIEGLGTFKPSGSGGGGAVESVNGKTGAVVLDASDVGALPDDTPIPTNTSDLTNDSGFQTAAQVSAAISTATASKADKTLRAAMTASGTAPSIDPNKLYVFQTMASLAPTEGE